MMTDLLEGKKVLITGSTHGIGKAYAEAMLKAGAEVAVNSFDSDPPPGLVEELSSLGPCHYVSANMADVGDAQRAVSEAFEVLGGLDVLVNNAGTHKDMAFLDNTPLQYEQTFDLNVRAYYFAAQAFVRLTGKRAFDASLICTGSINGLQAEYGSVLYDSSKGAILMLVRSLAVELSKFGIRVNGIAPGFVETPLTQQACESPEFRKHLEPQIPVGRLALPEDMGGTAVYLASDMSKYVTGQMVYVDGGMAALQGPG
jgi:glucose 1-dehydrogenase